MRVPFSLVVIACVMPSAAVAQGDPLVEELQRSLRARDAEIVELRRQVDALQRQTSLTPATQAAKVSPPVSTVQSPASASGSTAAVASVPARKPENAASSASEDDELTGALESGLVRQGGRVLASGVIEFEPEASYFYAEPITGTRRDYFGAAVTARVGLRGGMQAEVRLPYVVRDQWSGVGRSSGLGDIRISLTKEVLTEREDAPALLGFVQWRTTSGDINRSPSTGFGQNAVQVGMTVTKRQDPVVLFGSLSYTANLGTAYFGNGARTVSGNVLGGRLGAFLAATPDVSLFYALAFNSSLADRFNDQRVESTDRLRGLFELGTASVLGRGVFLNVAAGIGFTPAAPKFVLTVSVPIRF